MRYLLFILTVLTICVSSKAQSDISKFVGRYGDWLPNGEALVTELELRSDGTFKLRTVDHV